MTRKTLEERFWEKVDRSGGTEACWLWTAGAFSHGYGSFRRDARAQYAHRVAYELTNGPIPEDLCVLHRCDTPPCVNPSHLFLGTPADNAADRNAKGRQARGAKHSSALRATSGAPKTAPNASKYRGVCWREDRQKWQSLVRVDGRKLHLGLYADEASAAAAYLRAVELISAGETDRDILRSSARFAASVAFMRRVVDALTGNRRPK